MIVMRNLTAIKTIKEVLTMKSTSKAVVLPLALTQQATNMQKMGITKKKIA